MKDESLRNKAIEKMVAEKLRAGLKPQGPQCPAAEILAAYVERALAERERRGFEAHLASCLPCQEQVANLVRLSEADVRATELAAPLRDRRFQIFRWAWAAPVLVALLVVGIWTTGEFRKHVEQPQETRAPSPASSGAKVGPSPTATAVASNPLKSAPQTLAPSPGSRGAMAGIAGRGGALPNQSATPRRGAIATPSQRARLMENARSENREEAAGVGQSSLEKKESSAEAKPQAETPAPADELTGAKEKSEGRDRIAKAAPSAELAPGAPRAGSSAQMAKQANRRPAVTQTLVLGGASRFKTPSVAGVWRVGSRGLIQKADTQRNWVTYPSGVSEDLFDIAFADASNGWAVGQKGTILRTTDGGNSWTKISSPTTEDLIRVRSAPEGSVQIITRSGLVLATRDGGKSWTIGPP